MNQKEVIIIGGGLAGLTAAIHLAKNDLFVTLFEKETYPHHKVCGEYLSREVLPYMESLEIPVLEHNPKMIDKLLFSTHNGKYLENSLALGGLGISRYALDTILYRKAKEQGVVFKHEKVHSISYNDDLHEIQTSEGTYKASYVLGAYGKRAVLDNDLGREFFRKPSPWVAVKSHFQHESFPEDLVALHSFKGGYCGLSKTENEAVNVCYLATYESFKQHKNPQIFKESVLQRNPFLDRFFTEAEDLFDKPLTIAQVSFSQKSLVEDHVIMLGDAAGLIHPLCGNGMAMAIHSAKIASESLLKHLQLKTDRKDLEREYVAAWKTQFHRRMMVGKWLQKILLNESFTSISQSIITKMPFLLPAIIKQTHGHAIN